MNVLFVCLGNICRSPMAEGILNHLVNKKGLSSRFFIESAGTAAYHIGESADPRTLEVLRNNGITLGSKARQVNVEDFNAYDYILAMDHENHDNLMRIAPARYSAKVLLFREFDPNPGNGIVPDPYYGGQDGFKKVYEMLERTAKSFLAQLEEKGEI